MCCPNASFERSRRSSGIYVTMLSGQWSIGVSMNESVFAPSEIVSPVLTVFIFHSSQS